MLSRVHNRRKEESVELAIRVYNNSSQSNVTSGIAHVNFVFLAVGIVTCAR